jgi:hypothetical protein
MPKATQKQAGLARVSSPGGLQRRGGIDLEDGNRAGDAVQASTGGSSPDPVTTGDA